MQPRTPRSASDRGRYPEEAVHEETQREETPSDDDDEGDDTTFAFYATSSSEPITIAKPRTPASSVNGDDLSMFVSESTSFGSVAMDVDTVRTWCFSHGFLHCLSKPLAIWFSFHVFDVVGTHKSLEVHTTSDNKCCTLQ